jgi:hypothetical protein
MEYELVTLKDIFDKIPPDRIEACLHELAAAMKEVKSMNELVDATGDIVDVSLAWPDVSTWIDDGKRTLGLIVLEPDSSRFCEVTVQLAV